MMNDIRAMEDERTVLRWGGLAGILGGLIMILVFVIVAVLVGPDPEELEGFLTRFPGIRAVRTVENSLWLVVLILWMIHFAALYRALRGARLAPALFGSLLGILGLTVLAAGALVHVATAPIADLYHAPGATLEDRAALVLIWQATNGIFEALLLVGGAMAPIGLALLGLAMGQEPAFGRGPGRLSVVLGVVGLVAAAWAIVSLQTAALVFTVLGLVIFHLVLGWKVFGLSRAP